MRLTRVFVDAPLAPGARIALPEHAGAHLVRVLRLREGEACVLFNGDGHDYDARLLAANKRGVEAEVRAARAIDNESPQRIVLLQGIARGEKMDLILQKATELGVSRIAPVVTERTEVRLDAERGAKRLEHWRRVVASACEQCGRARLPVVEAPVELAVFAEAAAQADGRRYALDPDAVDGFGDVDASRPVTVAIGPEGGFGDRDLAVLRAAGFVGVRLGPRVLRTETAGLAALAVLQSVAGDFR